jgi:predicted enzyme related to lactoylglutathione lyase
MSERDGYEPGVPCWVDTWRADPRPALGFYSELFGWHARGPEPGSAHVEHHMLTLRGRDVAAIGSRPEHRTDVPAAWNTYVWVESADRAAAAAAQAGGAVVIEPFESLDGGRIAILGDPEGAAIGVWQPGAHRGAELVNEPGAWSMSNLNAHDVEGAKRFYGAVFGWETLSFGMGDAEIVVWRRPGYVGGEPEQPVPRDVVATMAPIGGAAEVPAHWSVDFWVDDTDAVAARADALDGSVITPPYEIPDTGMRQAVLADPDGATFSVTRVAGVNR